MTTLPPGFSASRFKLALADLQRVVGAEWVYRSDEDLALYRDAYSIFQGSAEEPLAAAAVAPDSVEQVVGIVEVANRHRLPIYPISTGRNLGYGGSAPVLGGSVVVDLKRMNRILEVNERNAYAIVEPGVSYFDLYRHIRERGLRLWIDCPEPGWGSPVGNALDRGVGYTLAQYRNHFDAHCGMEVVLPTGRVMRTGMGAMPAAGTWQQYKAGFGPWVDGLFSQSNFGIVTKMGFWLMPEPEAAFMGKVAVPRYRDIIPLVDVLNYLEQSHIVQGFVTMGSPVSGSLIGGGGPIGGPRPGLDPELQAVLNDPAGFDAARLEPIALRKGLPFWTCDLMFYGPPEITGAHWAYAKRLLTKIPGVTFEDGASWRFPLPEAEIDGMWDPSPFGVPTLKNFGTGPMVSFNGEQVVGHLFFSPIVPRTGEAVLQANEVLGAAARRMQLPQMPLTIPGPQFERSFIFVVALPVTRSASTNRDVRAMFSQLVKLAADHGWGEYRTAPAFYDQIMGTYSFNDGALLHFHESLKDAVDPNGILAAGRYGIWPRHIRASRGRKGAGQ